LRAGALRLGELVARFSPVAAVSVALLAGTGLYPALLHIPSLGALVQTTYGWALLVKLALVLLLLLLGAANLAWVGPGLRRGQAPMAGRLRWFVTAEVALMACVLGAAALLTNVAPARAAMPPATLNVLIHSQRTAAVLQMAPLSPGYHTLDVTIEPHDGSVGPDSQVTLELIMQTHDMGKNVTTGKYVGDGHFRFEQVLIGMAGPWEFRLTVTQPNAEPDLLTITVDVPEGL
jgi:copper transport protein